MHLLVGLTGSVATVKAPVLLAALNSALPPGSEIQFVATTASLHFLDTQAVSQKARLYTDKDEWTQWNKLSDPVLHVELRNWADGFLIAPLDANTLGKLAGGLCDNLLVRIAFPETDYIK
jgi:phosphopantothenoylcysteine decarboxylase